MSKVIDAKQATDIACKVIGDPPRFLPLSGKKKGHRWIIKAIIGIVDDIRVTVELPEKLVAF